VELRPYVLQAAIAVLHAEEPQDWSQLAALYGELARLTGSPVVELNRAVAIAEAGEVGAALVVESLELDRYHYLHATRAELLRRLDRVEDARDALTERSSSFTRTRSGVSWSGDWRSSRADRRGGIAARRTLGRRSRSGLWVRVAGIGGRGRSRSRSRRGRQDD